MMANGLEELQNTVTEHGQGLRSALSDLVSAHDAGDDGKFEEIAEALDERLSQLQSLGRANNQATKAGQSPSPARDLRQNAGPVEGDRPDVMPRREERDDGERDVVVKGRDMPD
jgi:hypothetical protein